MGNTRLKDMRNFLIGFSDGSLSFSTSCIYLISCDANSDKYQTSLINTMSKLAEDTQINKTAELILDKEMHGLWLAASNMIKAIQDIKEAKIPIEAAYIGVDTLSQVVGLMKPSNELKQKLRRYYANINLHLFEVAKLTDQKKEDIIFWIDQKDQPNPADKLGKFDINKETVDKWMELATEVLSLQWLQTHPNNYLEKLLNKSKEQIKLLK